MIQYQWSLRQLFMFSSAILLLLPGCSGWQNAEPKKQKKKGILSEINLPLTDGRKREAERRFFNFNDEDGEFFLMEDEMSEVIDPQSEQVAEIYQEIEYSWVQEEVAPTHLCKEIYFDFDKYCVRSDQEAVVEFNKEMIACLLKESANDNVTVRIDGHACSSAGSRVYNLALSERRAKIIFDKLVDLGIPKEKLKIVAWGQERPTRDEGGKTIVGDRKQQWRNRRVELHAV